MAFVPDTRTYAPGATAGATLDTGLRSYMLRVYNWMTSGLLLTGVVSLGISSSGLYSAFYRDVRLSNGMIATQPTLLGYASIFAPLAFVMALSFGVNRMSKTTVQAVFWAFAAAMGASMSNIFHMFEHGSIAQVFFITAGTFATMSLWGYTTRRDLTNFGGFLMMGLIGIIIASVVNMFMQSSAMQFGISILGVLIFVGLTAYDTQRIKADYVQYAYAAGSDQAAKRSVFDALTLYLNFINIFMFLLQLFGNRSSNN